MRVFSHDWQGESGGPGETLPAAIRLTCEEARICRVMHRVRFAPFAAFPGTQIRPRID